MGKYLAWLDSKEFHLRPFLLVASPPIGSLRWECHHTYMKGLMTPAVTSVLISRGWESTRTSRFSVPSLSGLAGCNTEDAYMQ